MKCVKTIPPEDGKQLIVLLGCSPLHLEYLGAMSPVRGLATLYNDINRALTLHPNLTLQGRRQVGIIEIDVEQWHMLNDELDIPPSTFLPCGTLSSYRGTGRGRPVLLNGYPLVSGPAPNHGVLSTIAGKRTGRIVTMYYPAFIRTGVAAW